MTSLQPTELAALLDARSPTGAGAWPSGRGVAYDSRTVRAGDVFFALPGSAGHGIDHAEQALQRGAAYLVSDRAHPRALLVDDAHAALHTLGRVARARLRAPVIAVTGSAGKTTTKTLITNALAARSTPGNLNTPPALVAALVEAVMMDDAANDTSSAAAHNTGAIHGPGGPGTELVLELGIDRLGEMDELVALTSPDHGLITTIGEAHLSALKDPATVAIEKSKLLVSVDGLSLCGGAAAALLDPGLRKRTVAVHLAGQTSPPSDMADVIEGVLDEHNVLHAFGVSAPLPWYGTQPAENALLALALAVRLGRDPETALASMVAAPLEHSRLERLRAGDVRIIDDSYNSNPLSVALALDVLRASPGPRVAFLGDMRELGAVSAQRHRELGAATTGLDMVIAIGPAAAAIRDTNPAARLAADATDAERYLDDVPSGATVLVKGSRSLLLERLVDAMLERFGGSRHAGTTPEQQPTEASPW